MALVEHLGSAEEVFGKDRETIEMILGPHSKYASGITEKSVREAEEELTRLNDDGIIFTGFTENGYPAMLKECDDPPIGLYIRSCSPPEDLWKTPRSISIVGTRDVSSYGREWCRRIVSGLAAASDGRPSVVSGLALGTDICAHIAALEEGLPTIGVMATGPDIIYPYRHRNIAERMVQTPGCALITDYPPGTAPLAIHFLRRNRIIAGLGEATLLIESKLRGGGMMTARLAFSYSRDVYALPGRVDDVRSQGCNELLRTHVAEPVVSVNQLISDLKMGTPGRRKGVSLDGLLESRYAGRCAEDRIKDMSRILTVIRKNRGITIEELAHSTGIDHVRVVEMAGMLEIDGLISIDLLQRCSINAKFI